MAKPKTIDTLEEVKQLVDRFYDKVNKDELLSPVFNEIAGVHWEKHLPVMYEFWSSILHGTQIYRGNPFAKHIPLPINKVHFERWLKLFYETLDENFEGEKAEEAKMRAASIAAIFEYRLSMINKK